MTPENPLPIYDRLTAILPQVWQMIQAYQTPILEVSIQQVGVLHDLELTQIASYEQLVEVIKTVQQQHPSPERVILKALRGDRLETICAASVQYALPLPSRPQPQSESVAANQPKSPDQSRLI